MAAATLWAWDETNKVYRKVVVDADGKLLISDADPFTIAQATPENLKHVPHGYYAAGPSYLPYAVDSAGKLQLSIAALQHLSDIADVNLAGLVDGDFIYYDSASGTWKRIAHKDATTGVHGVDAGTVAKVSDIAVLANIPDLTSGKIWQGDVTDRPAETTPSAGGYTQGARVYHNANQSISNVTPTALAFNSERYDTDTIHDTVTNNSRLTCKTAGKYLIIGMAMFAANATGSRQLCIKLNNTTLLSLIWLPPIAAEQTGLTTDCIFDLALDDYVELCAYQSSGGALNVVSGNAYSPEFMTQRVG